MTLFISTSHMFQLVQTVQRRDLVCLSERRKIENVVDEVIHSTFESHHRLADVDQLGRPVPMA